MLWGLSAHRDSCKDYPRAHMASTFPWVSPRRTIPFLTNAAVKTMEAVKPVSASEHESECQRPSPEAGAKGLLVTGTHFRSPLTGTSPWLVAAGVWARFSPGQRPRLRAPDTNHGENREPPSGEMS
jgi:hypothetical protein